MNPSGLRQKMGFLKLVTINVVVFGVLAIAIEGLASYGLLIRDVTSTNSLAERRHTKYDADIGWVNEPNVYIRDMYGPGVYLKTNAQGFRNDHDITASVPDGKIRVVCSGDSFTLGYGVDNAHTWCDLLSGIDPHLETVNMGQGGYGIDQAYLWYKRDAGKIAHQVHLLAFITDDFYRMLSDSFLGYGKPVLDTDNGTLVVTHVPVSKRAYRFTWITQNNENLLRLRTVEFLRRFLQKIRLSTDEQQLTPRQKDEQARKILRKVLEDLKRLNEARSSKLVLVYLPTTLELQGKAPQEWSPPEEWMEFLEDAARSLEIPVINLFGEFRSRSANEIVDLFIQQGQLQYPGAAGHFNNEGNAFVSRVIHNKLSTLSGITMN